MANSEPRAQRAGEASLVGAWRIAMPRLFLGSLILSLPGGVALALLVALGHVRPGPAAGPRHGTAAGGSAA